MILTDGLRAAALRIADFALGIQPDETLNPGPAASHDGDIGAQIMRASKTLLAHGIDPHSGLVDYPLLRQSSAYTHFRALTSALSNFRIKALNSGPEITAFWINIYNALIIDAIIHYGLQGSLMLKPGIFRLAAYTIDGMRFSADDIEHGILRQNRPNPVLPLRPFASVDPRLSYMVELFDARIHFALVCGARSCPPIAHYSADRLDDQLDLATGAFINGGGVHWDAKRQTIWLSKIFNWYEDDFGGREGVLNLIAAHTRNAEILHLFTHKDINVRYAPYDWSVNQRVGAADPLHRMQG